MSKVRYCCIQSKDSEQLALSGGSGNFVISTTLKDVLSSAAPSVNTLPRSDGDLQRLTCGFLSNYALSGGIRKTFYRTAHRIEKIAYLRIWRNGGQCGIRKGRRF
jgi:hypothetical protein